MSIFQDLELAEVDNGQFGPGKNWGPFTRHFDTFSHDDVIALGRVAGTMTLDAMVVPDGVAFSGAIQRFAAHAQPPIEDISFELAARAVITNREHDGSPALSRESSRALGDLPQ